MNTDLKHVQRDWSWMRVYYFERCKDALILEGVWPPVREASSSAAETKVYFQRDWIGGPNVLIGLGGISPNVREGIAQSIGTYLKTNPSQSVLSAARLHENARSLAMWEGRLADAGIDLRPNNTVHIESQEPFSFLLRHDALKVAVREFLSESSKCAVKWLEEVRTGMLQREQIAMQIMIAAAWVADRAQLRSHLSFRSHALGFLRVSDSEGRIARFFASRYSGIHGAYIRRLVQDSIESLENQADSTSGTIRYAALLRCTLADLYQGLQQSRYQPAPASELAGYSKDYEEIRRGIELLDENPALRAWQLMISLVYQTLNQLGIQPLQRFLACYLLSRAAEDLYGQSADKIAQDLYRTGDHKNVFSFFSELEQRSSTF